MRFQFIDDHRDQFPVIRMCKVLKVSKSGYYAWRTRPVSAREMDNQRLYDLIKAVYDAYNGVYGSPRIYHELKDRVACSENRIARLMRLHKLQAKQSKRFHTTTKRNRKHRAAPNILKRDFGTARPNQKWLTDITYIPTQEGWLYLAAVLDLYARRIVGWSMSDRMTSALTISALQMAIRQRRPQLSLLHHSDQGSQYTDSQYQALLKKHGIQVSMNGAGTWYDNAPMESFFGTLKSERVYHYLYRTRNEARSDLFLYIEGFYNRRRRHSSLGYLSPETYELLYYQRHGFA
jgi:transposase InsO family protein